MSWLIPAENLDDLQKLGVGLPVQTPVIISGEKLTGKTVTLLHRARRLQVQFTLSSAQLHLWTATLGIRDLLRSVAHLLGIPSECIECYDDWCVRVYREAVDAQLPVEPLTGAIATGVVRTVARFAVQWGYAQKPSFEVLLVDEAEAFSAADIAFMAGMTRHITLSASFGCCTTRVASLLDAVGRNEPDITLTKSYRRNPLIADFTAILRGISTEDSDAAHDGQRETLTYFPAPSFREEVVRLAEVLRDRMSLNELTGILVSDSRIGEMLARELRIAGIGVEVQSETNGEFPPPDFSNKFPKIFTFEGAHGLNFETVAIPCLSRRNFRGYPQDEVSGLLAEGASLATRWVYFSSAKPSPLRQLDRLEELGRPGLLHIPGKRHVKLAPAPSRVKVTAIDDLL
jgi:hypothetical protein